MRTREAQVCDLPREPGLLLFDSAHFFHHPLLRDTDWEIHPVLKMEYSPEGKACKAESDENWITSTQFIERCEATLYFSALERVLLACRRASVYLPRFVTF